MTEVQQEPKSPHNRNSEQPKFSTAVGIDGHAPAQCEDKRLKISDAAAGMLVPGPKIAATPASRNSA